MSFSNMQLIKKHDIIKLRIREKYVIFKYGINKKYDITINFMTS